MSRPHSRRRAASRAPEAASAQGDGVPAMPAPAVPSQGRGGPSMMAKLHEPLRERIATAVLAGLAARDSFSAFPEDAAPLAVRWADALIMELYGK
jgi:hypothetical protein